MDSRIKERLYFFLSQGIRGADALLSAIGPALEVFSRYKEVKKLTDEVVTVGEFLDKVREVVARHALSTVLSEQELGNVDPAIAFYVLWKWTFEPTVEMAIPVEEPEGEEDEPLLHSRSQNPNRTSQIDVKIRAKNDHIFHNRFWWLKRSASLWARQDLCISTHSFEHLSISIIVYPWDADYSQASEDR